ncbi:MAG: slipin family protein [Patescibacteria group bacterium]|nr:slipin family protein [Patescibacteria group bacterium]
MIEILFLWGLLALPFLLIISIKQINEYERGIRFLLGKYNGIMEPGWRIIIPVIYSYQKVDIRVKAVDVPDQDAITKDNVSVNVNAVLYYKVANAESAILKVEYFDYAVSQLAQTTMRDVVGEVSLDELLSNRDQISQRIQEIVDKSSDPWGIKIESVDLKHIELPENMKRTIAKQAEAEREKRAVIIKAEGEKVSADNMAKAANILASEPGALHLRTLQSINDLSSDQSNTVIFAVPLEILRAFEGKN